MSTHLQKFIARKKKVKEAENLDVKSFVLSHTEELVERMLAELKPKIISEVQNQIDRTEQTGNKILEMQKNVKDGKSIKGEPGKPGKDYILTESDKKEISSKIKVPIVKKIIEKTEVIKEQPIITNEIKEVAVADKPDEIVEKLNTLEQKIEQRVIKGLDDRFENIQTNLRNIQSSKAKQLGGGGMGNVVHQRFNLTSATTSVSLSNKVAANGYAIWVKYQGQDVSRNDSSGYSMASNNKDVNLGFTPVNGTYLDVIYMRTS